MYGQTRQILDQPDVLEIRLDSMAIPEVEKCCTLLRIPLLFTNRPSWEGGAFDGGEDKRIEPLLEAIRLRAAFIDFELRADPQLRQQLLAAIEREEGQTQMILSWHDFNSTPPTEKLTHILEQMIESKAHVGKIVTTAQRPEEVLRVLQLQKHAQKANFPLSCFCMGEAGRISRLATLYLGGAMTYTCLADAQATAAGQLSLQQMYQLNTLLFQA
ncbi:MAG: type I 3-dehydroquinate dehydratase [Candidatus Electrothrix sp. AR3]|nr:type I 3-dehydroquinate dehydratase [Candidatus Electrothrix sp. AR3]